MKFVFLSIALTALSPPHSATANELLYAFWDGDSVRAVQILQDTIPAGEKGTAERSAALSLAAEYGDLGATRYLVEQGADLEVLNSAGKSPLLLAVSEARTQVAIYLIQAGANLEVVDGIQMNTPLLVASRAGDIMSVKALVEAGANINALDYLGRNAINGAAFVYSYNTVGGDDLIVYLVKKGVDINHRDFSGETTLGVTQLQPPEEGVFTEIRDVLVRLGGQK